MNYLFYALFVFFLVMSVVLVQGPRDLENTNLRHGQMYMIISALFAIAGSVA